MIAARLYGISDYKHFDHLTVGLPHAEQPVEELWLQANESGRRLMVKTAI
jgi:hypothetical protein